MIGKYLLLVQEDVVSFALWKKFRLILVQRDAVSFRHLLPAAMDDGDELLLLRDTKPVAAFVLL